MWAAYRSKLSTHPLAVKSMTSAVIMSFADAGCQALERQTATALIEGCGIEECNLQDGCPTNVGFTPADRRGANTKLLHHDWRRTAHVAITGLAFAGPISHAWYGLLEAAVRVEHRAGALRARSR
jgi:hypothetical protein